MDTTNAPLTSINKNTASMICNEALAVLNKHFAGRNVQFTRTSGTYNGTSVNVKFTATVQKTISGERVKNDEEKQYDILRRRYPQLPEIGRQFTSGNECYRVIGASLRSPKYPIKCVTSNNKHYKFAVDLVVLCSK